MLKNPVFYVELKSLINNFNVSQFHHSHWFYEHFQKQPLGAVKHFAIFRIKKRLQHRFSCEYCKILRMDFL